MDYFGISSPSFERKLLEQKEERQEQKERKQKCEICENTKAFHSKVVLPCCNENIECMRQNLNHVLFKL